MGDRRSGARQTGAPSLTLTRRQQKRARKQQYKRRTAQPAANQATATQRSAASQTTATQQSAAPEKLERLEQAAPTQSVRPEAAATSVVEIAARRERKQREQSQARKASGPKRQLEPRQAQQPTQPERSAGREMARQRAQPRTTARTVSQGVGRAAGAGEHDVTRPAVASPRVQRVSKQTRLIPSVRVAEATDSPAASGRKYPTLARMAAAPAQVEAPVATPRSHRRDKSAAQGSREARIGEQMARAERPTHDAAAASAWDQLKTEPVPVVSPASRKTRRPVPTLRLRDEPAAAAGAGRQPRNESNVPVPAPRHARPVPLPRTELATPVAVVHAAVAAIAALTGAALLVQGQPGALWALSLALIAGAGGWLAYALAQPSGGRRSAGQVLVTSQVATLAWLMALLGPRAALLAGVPALALLALRMAGRGAALGVVMASFVLYAAGTLLTLGGVLVPALSLDAGGQTLVDALALAAGLSAALFGLLNYASRTARAEQVTQARVHETHVLRARLAQLTQQLEDDGERLDAALAHALQGSGIPPVSADGALRPLAETVNAVADRLKTLQRDREDRLRLEGSVRAITRAVERAWLGLPWAWPDWSGTATDELVALLRTPRPHDEREGREARAAWNEETPTLLQLPALARGPMSRPSDAELPQAHPSAYPYGAKAANGWSQPLSPPFGVARTPVRSSAQETPLPWSEWNKWPNWEA